MDISIGNDLRLFSLDPAFLINAFKQCQDVDAIRSLLKAMKQEIKQERRKLAKKHHPDVEGDHDKMADVNRAYDRLMKLKVEIRKPVVVNVSMWNPTANSAATYSGSYSWTSTVQQGGPTSAESGVDLARGYW